MEQECHIMPRITMARHVMDATVGGTVEWIIYDTSPQFHECQVDKSQNKITSIAASSQNFNLPIQSHYMNILELFYGRNIYLLLTKIQTCSFPPMTFFDSLFGNFRSV